MNSNKNEKYLKWNMLKFILFEHIFYGFSFC